MSGKTVEKGVYLTDAGRFEAQIPSGTKAQRPRRRVFDTIEEARAARAAAKERISAERRQRAQDKLDAERQALAPLRKARKEERERRRLEARTEKEIHRDQLREVIAISRQPWYDPETGHVFRRGKRAEKDDEGYLALSITIDGKRRRVPAHRFAFFYMNGIWPVGPVDHINGIKHDNRWCNLRETTTRENNANVAIRHSRQVVRLNGKYYPIGPEGYDCPHEAALAAEVLF